LNARRIARILRPLAAKHRNGLENGIEHGTVRKDVSPHSVAALLIATLAGIAGTVKSAQSPDLFRQVREALFGYLNSLKP